MASIHRRGKYWRVQIRKQGYPYLSATFDTKAEAVAWSLKKAGIEGVTFHDLWHEATSRSASAAYPS